MHHNIIYSYILRSLYSVLLNPKMMSSLSKSLSSYIGITTITVRGRGLAMYGYVVDERKKPAKNIKEEDIYTYI